MLSQHNGANDRGKNDCQSVVIEANANATPLNCHRDCHALRIALIFGVQ
jgi:hypothetical protein